MNDEDLFHLALEEPIGERSAFLDRECAGDVSRRRRVDALLRSHETPDSFLAGAAADVALMASIATPGLCPRCLLGNAPCDDTAVTYPFLSGGAGRVLETLAATVGSIPRVLLPDTQGQEDRAPVIQPSSPEMPSPVDRTGRVTLLGEIARGGMGAVLKGHDPDLGRDLAVKVLLETHRDKAELVRRFIEEAQIAGQLQHPGIVPVYELGTFGDARPYFTMKLVKGSTLAQLLVDRPTPEAGRTRFLGIFEQVCLTVAYAHARGVIHRDLKPSNVMVGSFGEVQVMDWGLAKVLPRGGAADDDAAGRTETPVQETVIATARRESDSDLSLAGSVLGTPSYMAPEQARGEVGAVDERADVFALGSMLCEILTGLPAFTGRTSGEIQRKAAGSELAESSSRLAGCGGDGELVALARDCLAPEPDDRPRDAGAVAGRLTAYLEGVRERLHAAELAHAAESARAEEAVRTAAAAQAQARAERRSRRLTLALAASVIGLIVLGGGGAAWLQQQRASRSSATARSVNEALAEALRLEGTARAATDADPLPWSMALAEARRADALLAQGEADAFLRGRVSATLADLTRRHDEAIRLAENDRIDRKLLADLSAARLDLAAHLNSQRENAAYVAAFRAAGLDVDRTDPQTAGRWISARKIAVEIAAFLDDWGFVRYQLIAPKRDGAEGREKSWRHLLDVARAADPNPWRNTLRLGALGDPEALKGLADHEAGLMDKEAVSLSLLSVYLNDIAHDQARAERVSRLNWRLHPDDFWVNFEQANVYEDRAGSTPEQAARRRNERLRFLTTMVALRPDNAFGFSELARTLEDSGRMDEAVAMRRETIQRRPNDSYARNLLGLSLVRSGHAEEGLAQLRMAVEQIGGPVEHFHLGTILLGMGKYEEAVIAYREAVRLDGKHLGEAIFHLGGLHRQMGRYDEATDAFRRAAELAIAEVRPDYVRRAENDLRIVARYKALAPRLPDLVSGMDRPKDGAELYEIISLCRDRRLDAAGAWIYEAACEADPQLADDPVNRYNAACKAAKAGCGQGVDDPPPDVAEKARLRALALAWLRSLLAPWPRRLEDTPPADRAAAGRHLDHWRADPDLTCVRLPVGLTKLPAAEREAWRTFWDEVDALVAKSRDAPH